MLYFWVDLCWVMVQFRCKQFWFGLKFLIELWPGPEMWWLCDRGNRSDGRRALQWEYHHAEGNDSQQHLSWCWSGWAWWASQLWTVTEIILEETNLNISLNFIDLLSTTLMTWPQLFFLTFGPLVSVLMIWVFAQTTSNSEHFKEQGPFLYLF